MMDVVPLAVNASDLADSINAVWILTISFLIFFMQPGFLLLEVGQVRSKNVANVAMKNMFDWSLGVLAFFLVGLGLARLVAAITAPEVGLSVAESFSYVNAPGEWIGWLAGAVFAMTAATIVSGAVVERIKFKSYIIYSAMVTMVIYPVVVGLTWQGGLLSEDGYLGVLLGTGYLDFAGGTIVHMVGGIAGLTAAYILGPRQGRYDEDGSSNPIPGHSVLFAVLGTLFLAFGWYGFNVGTQATVLVEAGDVQFLSSELGRVALVTTLGMGAGTVTSSLVTVVYQGKPDPLFTANGMLAGLVAITAGAAYVTWWGGLVIGALGGALVYPTYQWTIETLRIDDVCGVFAVHGGVGGIGAILIPFFAHSEMDGATTIAGNWAFLGVEQTVIQFIGVLVIGTWTVLATMGVFLVVKLLFGLRIGEGGELEGLDRTEHNIVAYPNFVTDGGVETTGGPTSVGTQEADEPTMWRGKQVGDDSTGTLGGAGIENLPDAAFVVDRSDEVTALNSHAVRLFETVQEEAVGARPPALVDAADDALEASSDAMATEREVRDRTGTITLDGDQIPISVTATPLYEDDAVVGAMVLVRNNAEAVARTRQRQTVEEYRDEVLDHQEAKLERLASGQLDLDRGVPEPDEYTDLLDPLYQSFDEIDRHIVETAANVSAIVERLPEQSEKLAQTSTRLTDDSNEASEAMSAIDDLTTEIDSEVDDLSTEVEAANQTVSELSAAIEEVSASTTEIEQQSDEATRLTDESVEEMTDAVETIRRATAHSDDVADQIESLEAQMESVTDIVDIIHDIADQTNMLALNASIEAANADASGDGFAVVADEVKSLAEQTKESAGDIADIVERVQQQTSEVAATIDDTNDEIGDGADAVERAVSSLETVRSRTQATNDGITEISDAVQRQAENTNEVSTTMQSVTDRTGEIHDLASRISTRADSQTETMDSLSELAERLSTIADDVHANISHFDESGRGGPRDAAGVD
jgi:Amt family ammonium transporter